MRMRRIVLIGLLLAGVYSSRALADDGSGAGQCCVLGSMCDGPLVCKQQPCLAGWVFDPSFGGIPIFWPGTCGGVDME